MLLFLNAHDGVDCLKSLLSSQLTERLSKRRFSQRGVNRTNTWQDTSPPENWKPFTTPGCYLFRNKGEEQSKQKPYTPEDEAPASCRCLIDLSKTSLNHIESNWARS